MIVFIQPLQSAQMPIIKIKHFLCLPLTALPNHYLMLHRHWRIHILRYQRANTLFDCITQVWYEHICLFARELEEYSNEAHLSAVMAAIQYLRLFFKTNMMKSLTMNPQMMMISIHAFRTLQRPPSSRKFFLERFLTVQLSNGRLKCAMILDYVFVHVQSIPVHGEKTIKSLFIMIMNARWVS